MNDCGYQRLSCGDTDQAIEIFRQNAKNHPGSSNAYDSLGEAFLKKGNKALALENYKKSVELNPNNERGKEILQKILHGLK
ncbi:tetratricopeptide repeat protein [Pedobacter sp. PAMC26386]|nr:tetratricopeptide repeat protein [Pedobacter sp. PAMC26386]